MKKIVSGTIRRCKEFVTKKGRLVRCKHSARHNATDCGNCCKRKWRQKYPHKAKFQTMKHNATRRGKSFSLTFEQFMKIDYEQDYVARVGRHAEDASMDRDRNEIGYEEGNLTVRTVSYNSSKGSRDWSVDPPF